MIRHDSCLKTDTRNSLGTSGNVFEGLPARGEPSSALFENEKNLASSSCGLKSIGTGKIVEPRGGQEAQDSTNPTPRFVTEFSTWNPQYRAGGTYPQICMMEFPRTRISELHFGKFPDSVDFQCWKVNFKTEVCSNSVCPTITMLWIKAVEIAKSVDDLVIS